MIQFKQLSFWEKVTLLEDIDFLIVGCGIVGSACALELRSKNPSAKIVILERSYLPLGASTKNAGFACFGSVTELLDDLETSSEETVWNTVNLRYQGLKRLLERYKHSELDYQNCGSYDLLKNKSDSAIYHPKLEYLNQQIELITGQKNCYSFEADLKSKFGLEGFQGGYFNQLEGAIDTGKLLLATQKDLAKNGIITLFGIEVKLIEPSQTGVILETNYGEIKAKKTGITVNGFAKKLLPNLAVEPARAQVLVTSEIPNLPVKGTFHLEKGYYYFRNVGNRILFGGGRNLDFKAENTFNLDQTSLIQNKLEEILSENILPKQSFTVEYRWSGTMGIGEEKSPIIEKINQNCAVGVRLGGMGVAIGSLVGESLAKLLNE
ncbi:NAD(P)/FAD-dependent oxidoreductase [Fluviicola taffensis]|uniref:FAD dependent oxidoreductase n=1 Tax=Fluviicola taffensis (strain DSM 16823 / NCIMB 13979 / RW262) TaxID=755732 RepID=F2IE41_FLUTR|nr:FAD-dependent oxidoreductase [Fluviicola taffensis]AEA45605.1 FAD dependent oxidoreductase [Fluviicola taffensis DSM 16823]